MGRNRKLLAILFIFITTVLIGLLINSTLSRRGKTAVILNIVPSNSVVEVDGKTFREKQIYLKPGEYTFKVSAEGFANQERQIYVNNNENLVTFLLEAESDDAQKWAEENQEAYFEAEGRAGDYSEEKGREISSENPIMSYLPKYTYFYKIDYTLPENNNRTSLIITADTATGRYQAIEKIRSMGFDPTDYVIEFRGIVNPLDRELQGE